MTHTLVWIGILLLAALLLWMAEPYHTRLIDAAHGRIEAREAAKKTRRRIWRGKPRPPADRV
jgi:hypothetical protein